MAREGACRRGVSRGRPRTRHARRPRPKAEGPFPGRGRGLPRTRRRVESGGGAGPGIAKGLKAPWPRRETRSRRLDGGGNASGCGGSSADGSFVSFGIAVPAPGRDFAIAVLVVAHAFRAESFSASDALFAVREACVPAAFGACGLVQLAYGVSADFAVARAFRAHEPSAFHAAVDVVGAIRAFAVLATVVASAAHRRAAVGALVCEVAGRATHAEVPSAVGASWYVSAAYVSAAVLACNHCVHCSLLGSVRFP